MKPHCDKTMTGKMIIVTRDDFANLVRNYYNFLTFQSILPNLEYKFSIPLLDSKRGENSNKSCPTLRLEQSNHRIMEL